MHRNYWKFRLKIASVRPKTNNLKNCNNNLKYKCIGINMPRLYIWGVVLPNYIVKFPALFSQILLLWCNGSLHTKISEMREIFSQLAVHISVLLQRNPPGIILCKGLRGFHISFDSENVRGLNCETQWVSTVCGIICPHSSPFP